jgi:thioredoxin:protein disulfide reductase
MKPADRVAGRRPALALAGAFLAATCVSHAVAAEPRLLPPEQAFAFSAQAVDDKTVEARISVASGYYLYRDKVRFSIEPAMLAEAPLLPPGKVKEDAFFGKVETYRGRLAVRLPLERAEPGQKVTIRSESQGCADAGVCYPPQVQSVTVTLPMPGARPDAEVAATPRRKSWFN